MRKILLTSLGVGTTDRNTKSRTYKEANYEIDGKIYEKNKYISLALDKAYNFDKIFYIGTLGSMWEAVYEDYCIDNNIEKNSGYDEELQMKIMEFEEMSMEEKKSQSLDFLNLSELEKISNGKIKSVVTRYGLNDNENFQNFNKILEIMEELEDGDKIYLDITHSFRSNALWMFLVTNYINNVSDKKLKIVSMTYGMFEAKEKINGVEITPVIDLNSFIKLTEWLKGAYAFEKSGNSELLINLLNEDDSNFKLCENVDIFSKALNTNYYPKIKESITKLKKAKELIDRLDGPAKLIVPKTINEFIARFSLADKDYITLIKLANWHKDEGRYGFSYINIVESIKAYILDYLLPKENRNKNYKENEECFKNFISTLNNEIKKLKNKDSFEKEIDKFLEIYKESNSIRNIVAHSSTKTINLPEEIQLIESRLKSCEKIYKNINFLKECSDRFNLEK